jgi:hypothetical protein
MKNQRQELFNIGDAISIAVGGAVGLSCVASEMLHGTIVGIAEKTINIQCENVTCWFPKKAVEKKTSRDWYTFRKWFKPNTVQAWFIDRYSNISGQSKA